MVAEFDRGRQADWSLRFARRSEASLNENAGGSGGRERYVRSPSRAANEPPAFPEIRGCPRRERSGVLPAADPQRAQRQVFPVGTRHTATLPNVCAPPAQRLVGGWKLAAPLTNLRLIPHQLSRPVFGSSG